MQRTVFLNNQKIIYNLERKSVKNINLRIKSDLTISVSANKRVKIEEIENFMQKNSDTILNGLKKIATTNVKRGILTNFLDGEIFRFLGNYYTLKIVESKKNSAFLQDDFFVLCVTDVSDIELKNKTVQKFLTDQSKIILPEICKRFYYYYRSFKIDFPEIKFRKMISCWGNCRPKQCVLTFNTSLVQAPLPAVEYVVAHEFTHFLHADHSKYFYKSLEDFMPDWKIRKELL